jgi:hypothetical protein
MQRNRPQTRRALPLTLLALVVGTTALAAGPSRDLGDYVVLGLTGARLGNETFIVNGNFGANNVGALVQLGQHTFMANGTELVGDQARVLERSSLCALFTNALLTSPTQITVRCAGPTPFAPLPVIAPLPSLPTFAPGVAPVGSGVLAPGAYGSVTLHKRGRLKLTGGVYEVGSFNVGREAKVLVDGPTTIDVLGNLRIGDASVFGPVNPGFDVTVNVGGTQVRFGREAMAVMDLFAPNALIKFGKLFFGKGHFVGLLVGSDKHTMFDGGTTLTTPTTSTTSTTAVSTTSTTAGASTSTTTSQSTSTSTSSTSPSSTTTVSTSSTTTTTTPGTTSTTTASTTTTSMSPTSTTIQTTSTTSPSTSSTTTTSSTTSSSTTAPSTTSTTTASTTTTSMSPTSTTVQTTSTTSPSMSSTTTSSSTTSSTTSTTPPGSFCTMTQGAAGAPSGYANGPTGVITLNPTVLPVTVGAPGDLSLTVHDQAALICFLPATGTPASLCTGLGGCGGDMLINACSNPPILDFNPSGNGSSGGQGGGTLTGQTIVAKLAVALSALEATPPGLATFVLPPQLCTTAGTFTISPALANGVRTVSDLLLMADQALRDPNAFTGSQRSDLTNALEAVNQGFDECQSVLACP